jgi:hypothetical protein
MRSIKSESMNIRRYSAGFTRMPSMPWRGGGVVPRCNRYNCNWLSEVYIVNALTNLLVSKLPTVEIMWKDRNISVFEDEMM